MGSKGGVEGMAGVPEKAWDLPCYSPGRETVAKILVLLHRAACQRVTFALYDILPVARIIEHQELGTDPENATNSDASSTNLA